VEPFRCDLPQEIDGKAFEGADILVHCAHATAGTHQEAERVNTLGTMRLYELAKRSGMGLFVFVSSTGASSDAESYYGRTKYRLEQEMDPAKDLILRPGLIIGPGPGGLFNRMRRSIERLPVVPIFDGGHQILQTVHIDDLCRAVARATGRGLTGVLVVAEPEGIEMRRFLRELARRLGRRRFFAPLPLGGTLGLARACERLRIPLPFSSENLLGLKGMRLVPSAADLARLGLEGRGAEQSLATVLGPRQS
jgi:NADH dehydrogenase